MRTRTLVSICSVSISSLVGLAACGSEVGRAACPGPNESIEATITIPDGKPVSVWSDLDISYEGNKNLTYQIELYQDGKQVYEGSCDPRDVNVKMNSVSKNVGSRSELRQQGKLKCPEITGSGEFEVEAELVADEGVTVSGCDLVFKQ